MKKIKVLNVIWSMKAGGAQQVVLNYLRDFKDDPDIDFSVCVYTAPTNSKYDQEIKREQYKASYLNNPETKIQIPYIKRFFQRSISQKVWADYICKLNPDIIHVHISPLLADTLPGIVKNNVPVRFDTLHSSPYRYKGYFKRVIVKAFQNENVIPICVTEAQVEEAKDWYGITKYEVVRNGVDIEKIKAKCCSKIEARKEFRLSTDDFVVIGVGRLNPIKKYDLLIDAFAEIKKQKSKWILTFAF